MVDHQPGLSKTFNMKIAQFIHTDNCGGAETLVVNIAAWLTKNGIDNVIVLIDNPYIEKHCALRGLSFVKLPSDIMRFWSIKLLPGFAFKFGRFLRDLNVTVLHSHLFGPTLRGALTAWAFGLKHIATQHDVYTIQDKPRRHLWLAAAAYLKTKLVAVSEDMNMYYRSYRLLNKFDIKPVYNGVNSDVFGPTGEQRDPAKVKFVYVGRLEKVKGLDRLIQAFDGINDELPFGVEAELHIYGVGGEEQNLKDLADELMVDDWVTFHGHSDNIPKVLAEHDVFVMTSHSEGLSCSIMEAMLTGLPIVATDVGGNRELVKDNKNGFLLDFIDAPETIEYSLDEVRDCLIELASKPKLRYNFGVKSLRLAKENFSLDRMMNQYLKLYRE